MATTRSKATHPGRGAVETTEMSDAFDGIPAGYRKIEAYTNGRMIVVPEQKSWPITNDPEDGHNCDVMGCGQEHIVARIEVQR